MLTYFKLFLLIASFWLSVFSPKGLFFYIMSLLSSLALMIAKSSIFSLNQPFGNAFTHLDDSNLTLIGDCRKG